MLRVRSLTAVTAGRTLLHGVDLDVPAAGMPGARTAVVGASGSGKSLTAAAVLGRVPPGVQVTGSVRLADQEVLGVPAPRRADGSRPSAVGQDPSRALHPLVAVGTQVAAPLQALGARRSAARAQALDLLGAVGFADPRAAASARPAELSGGQRQRACLALALARPGPLLVADEPTTALDVVTQTRVVELLRERTGGPGQPALLFITHDLAVAAQLCQRVVVVEGGRFVEVAHVAELLSAPTSSAARALVAAARRAHAALPPRTLVGVAP
ncbi:peptide/nickel transport system ATP-binding protein [Quadrisphaera granulorum]|uniref:Peptide/nickel transport system ATP-binding protein n=1 Tax=Quadrisphaera granulorum TaxID=317664 RepID=A0A316A1V5_9ACTN|nr:peptide/nickel transport system ATP-binding protein [Quadrisphaera granulorum]SZE97932.1 peptide/nickel transport system ATP-binding protein [Quadrisphaera granulorum]